MKINWKLRFQNKTTLLAIVVQGVALVYTVLGAVGVTPGIGQDQVKNLIYMLVELLCLLGIVVDPTTQGIYDSERALHYSEPK